MFSSARGRLRKRTSGVDRLQAACIGWGSDLVKEISQTCDRSATVRPACRTLNRRMVTTAEPVYSHWFIQEEYEKQKTLYRSGSTPQLFYGLYAAGKRQDVFERMEARGFASVCQQAAAKRRGGCGSDRQYPVLLRGRGAARKADRGSRSEPVPGNQSFGEEDGSQ